MVCEEDVEFWKESTEWWRKLFENEHTKVKKLEVEIERLKNKLWWTSGGF